MNSARDDLPAFEATLNENLLSANAPASSPQESSSDGEDTLPTPEPLSDHEQILSFVRMASDRDDVHMSSLMSVSDSSDEQDEFVDDDNSEWEDEDDAWFNDLLAFRSFRGIHVHRSQDEDPARIDLSAPPTPSISRNIVPQRPPPRRTQLEESPDDISGIARMLDVFHLGSSPEPPPSGPIPPEMFGHMVTHDIVGQEASRPWRPELYRAKILVQGLEPVPKGLLVRIARVGGAPGSYEDLSGDEEESAAAGCAVCWATLHHETPVGSGSGSQQTLSFSSEVGESAKVVSLPCSHIFHSACLLPWFSRPGTTTCPTCRFDIDPDALTRSPPTQFRTQSFGNSSPNPAESETSMDDWEDETIHDELVFFDSTPDFDGMFFNNIFTGGNSRNPEGRVRIPRDTWTLPRAPGKTLGERIIEKEREMGLRCMDAACVFAPTDEDPYPSILDTRQISIQTTLTSKCKHALHPACLVMSARAAGLPSSDEEFSAIEVSCPCCRTVGVVSKRDWENGVEVLARINC